MKRLAQVGVLASGKGTNLQALAEACRAPGFPARIALVISNVPDSGALERARTLGLSAAVIDHRAFDSRAKFEQALVDRLKVAGVEWVCLAGFMRVLGPTFLTAFLGRVLNIHPSLLPSFPGLHAVQQAFDRGVKVTGCTVHLVEEEVDAGPIIAQEAVPVFESDGPESLAARVHEAEHRIFPLALRWVAEGRVRFEGRVARIRAAENGES